MFIKINNTLINSDCIKNVVHSNSTESLKYILVEYKDCECERFLLGSYDEVVSIFDDVMSKLCPKE